MCIFVLTAPRGARGAARARALRETGPPGAATQRFDLAGATSVTAALSLLVYAVVDANAAGWGSARTVALLAVSAMLLAAFAVVERRTPAPILPLRFFRVGVVLGSNVASALFGAALFGMFFVVTLYLQRALGYSPLHAGLAWLALSVSALIASGTGARLVTRVVPRLPLATGLSIATAGLWLLSRLPQDARYLDEVMPALAVAGLGIGLAFVTLSIGALEGVNESEAGLASGLVNATQQIGGALGVAILSTVALSAGFADALLVAAAFAAAGALFAAYAVRPSARPSEAGLALPYRAFTPREPPAGLLHPTLGMGPGDVKGRNR
jgi:predicted MFS family arabinose efflux permease